MSGSILLKAGIALLVLAGLPAPVAANGTDTRHLQGLGDTRYLAFDSDGLGRRLHVYVMLPEGYDDKPTSSYPTVYLLDGGNLFPMLVPYYGYLRFAGEIPEAIVVGISYGSDSFEGGNLRSTDYTAPSEERDYWGGAGAFQRFLATELLPGVERRYRSRSDRRIIFGQSLGGQFVLYTAMTEPGLFWGHIASNPALHRNLDFFLEAHWADPGEAGDSRLFVGSASGDDPQFRGPAMTWIQHWSSAQGLPFELETAILEGHGHMSAPPAAFRAGMRWLFDEEPRGIQGN